MLDFSPDLANFSSVLGEGVIPPGSIPRQKPRWEPGSKVSESSKDLLLWNHVTFDYNVPFATDETNSTYIFQKSCLDMSLK